MTVVLFHFQPHVSGKLDWPILGPIVRHGDLGVDLFFILSGMVMQRVYGEARRSEGFSFRQFIIKRFARIYPVHFVTTIGALGMFVVAGAAGVIPFDGKTLAWAIPVHLLMLHGLGPIQATMALNFPSWSISAEMFAYFCFPAFALLYRGNDRQTVFWLALLSILALALAGTDWIEFGAVRIASEFLIGMGVGRLLQGRSGPWRGVALLVAGLAIYGACLAYQPMSGWIIIAFAMMLGGSALAEPLLGNNPAISAMMYLGRISFSIYMVHALVMSPGFVAAEKLLNVAPDQSPDWVAFVLLGVTVAAAAILFHVVEEPCRRWLVALLKRPRVSRVEPVQGAETSAH